MPHVDTVFDRWNAHLCGKRGCRAVKGSYVDLLWWLTDSSVRTRWFLMHLSPRNCIRTLDRLTFHWKLTLASQLSVRTKDAQLAFKNEFPDNVDQAPGWWDFFVFWGFTSVFLLTSSCNHGTTYLQLHDNKFSMCIMRNCARAVRYSKIIFNQQRYRLVAVAWQTHSGTTILSKTDGDVYSQSLGILYPRIRTLSQWILMDFARTWSWSW